MQNDLSPTMQEFYRLVEKAVYDEWNYLEIPMEKGFTAVLNFVLEHPNEKEEFIEAFKILIDHDNLCSPNLMQFCMHTLKWKELKDYFSQWLASEKRERVRYILKKIIMSFDDDWYGADIYERFKKQTE